MAQITSGLRAIFSSPHIYDLAQDVVGAGRSRAILVREHLRFQGGQKLLDIGCGTSSILAHLPRDVAYVGVDLSESYIESAKRRFGSRGEFHCVDIAQASPGNFGGFDRVLANGLLHHLDDDEVRTMLRVALLALNEGGLLVTIDPCFDAAQSRLARITIEHDRGRNVRTALAYEALAKDVFPDVTTRVRSDMLRIPYTHTILECQR